jgi:biotin carboxylase
MSWLALVESNTTGSGRLFCARARELGLRPVMLARDPDRYPYLAQDRIETLRVDTTDPAAVRAACAGLAGPLAGVTSSSEYFIATASEVAGWMGLPHPDPEAVRACRDKAAQRARLAAAGVPGAVSASAGTPAEAVAAAGRIGYPVVVKPIAGSGSVATRRCADAATVEAAARAVLAAGPGELGLPPQEAVVVEEYLAGPEYSVETFDLRVIGVTRKHLGPEPYFLEIGHDFPARLPEPARAAITGTALAALRGLGLGWGPAHVELRHTTTGPRIVEVNPRLAGGMIPRMVQEATGIDLIGQTVARAAGHPGQPAATRNRAAAIRFLVAETPGRLVEIDGLAEARRVPGVVLVGLTRQPGQELVLRHSFQDRLGYVIAVGPEGAVAAGAAEAGLLALKARVVPGRNGQVVGG